MQPEPLARVEAGEALELAGRRRGGFVDPGSPRPRRRHDDREHVKDVHPSRITTAGRHDERRVRPCRERRGGAIAPGTGAEEIGADRVVRLRGDLVDHHGDASAALEYGERPRDGPFGRGQREPAARTCGLPERVERACAQVLRDDEELRLPSEGARRQVPVARVRRRQHDPAAERGGASPGFMRGRIEDRVRRRLVAPRGHPQKLEHGAAERPIHAARRGRGIRDSGPAHRVFDVGAPDPEEAARDPAERGADGRQRAPRRQAYEPCQKAPGSSQANPARRTTRPVVASPSRATAKMSVRTTTKISRFGLRA